ncbi:MAG: lysophospholipid acyltransferase family protein [Candidatus Omnitrophota bacterium]|jgi:KDO2-lipid IV(A) lauroyltransferase
MYYLYVFAKSLCLTLPRNVCYALARVLATVHYYLAKKDREIVLGNLLPVITNSHKRKECAKKIFINFAYYLVDFFRSSRLDKSFIDKYVTVTGLDHLDKAFSSKKGMIANTAHIGNYELAGAVTSLLGYNFYAVALAHKDGRINKFFNGQRKSVGIKIIPAGVATRKCFSLLKNGGFVAFLGDRDFLGAGIKIKMFSREVVLPRGPAFFARKTGACIIPAFLVREKRKFYRLVFESPIYTDKAQTDEEIVKKYSDILQKYIRLYPEQWYLFQPYWL